MSYGVPVGSRDIRYPGQERAVLADAGSASEFCKTELSDCGRRSYRKRQVHLRDREPCTSFTVMRERRITDAITTDDGFRIAGFRPLLGPSPGAA